MNRELLTVRAETPAHVVRGLLQTFAVGAVPVLDEHGRPLGIVTAEAVRAGDGTAADAMSRPPTCVEGSTRIDAAARHLALAGVHHLIVVDSAGRAVGIVSALDLLRATLGMPVHHPAAFPHWDATTKSSWTDEWPLDGAHTAQAPDGAGVLVLASSSVGERDVVVWAEACVNVRDRVAALTEHGPSEPALARLLERCNLRFRAAVCDDVERERITHDLLSNLDHCPPPGAT